MKKLLFLALVLTLCYIFITAPEALAKPTLSVDKFLIVGTGDQENAPLIDGNLVVYRRHSAPEVDIFGFNLKTKTEFPLVQRPGHQHPTALSNNFLLYTDDTLDAMNQNDVRLLNIKTGKDILIAGGPGMQTAGAMSGRYLAYIEGYHCGRLYIYDLIKNKKADTTHDACNQVRMDGFLVIWSDNHDVYQYNILSKELSKIAEGPTDQGVPDIFNWSVVWLGYDSSKFTLYEKNLLTKKEKVVYESVTSRISAPVVSQNYIAWVDDRGTGAHDIFAYSRKTGEIVEVSNDGPQQISPTIPDIDNNTIVWMSWVSGNGDIYGATIKK